MKMNGYWVYKITTPDNMVYVGMSGCKYEWRRWYAGYEGTALQPYIDKYGLKNLIKEIIKQGLTKQEAQELEEELRQFYLSEGVIINKLPSGGEWSKLGKKEYEKKYYQEHKEEHNEKMRQYREEHKEEDKEWHKNYYLDNRERLLNKQREYYKKHKEEVKEYQRMYGEKHKEKIKEYNRRYREKKKLEKLGYLPLF